MFEDYSDFNLEIDNGPKLTGKLSNKRQSDVEPPDNEKRLKLDLEKPSPLNKIEINPPSTSRSCSLSGNPVTRMFPGPSGVISGLNSHEIEINRPSTSRSCSSSINPVTRMFPGPAGLISGPDPHEIEINRPSTSRSCSSSINPVKRRFPGPAGLISDIDPSEQNLSLTQDVLYSQSAVVNLEADQWIEMLKDFGGKPSEFTIKTLKSQAEGNRLPGKKFEFLAAFIQNVEHFGSNSNVNLTLNDPTGSIVGVTVNKLYSEHHAHLRIGSVIVLRHVGVLTLGKGSHFLTITNKSLDSIYAKEPKSDKNVKIVLRKCVNTETLPQSKNCEKTETLPQTEEDIVKSALEGIDTSGFFDDF